MGPEKPRRTRRAAAAALAVAVAAGLALALWPRIPAAPADRPPAALPARGALSIVAYGTSLTASNGWPDRLAARLTDCLGRPVTVTRVARNGAGTPWALRQVAAVAALEPDLVLMEFVVNDADLRDGLRRADSRANHAAILDALAAAAPRAQVMLLTMNPVRGPLRRLQRPLLAGYDAMLRDLAAARGLALADLAPRWRAAIAADPGLAPADGLHPGDAATAQVTVPALAALIGPAAGAPDC